MGTGAGAALALAQVGVKAEVDGALRQLAAVCLRQQVVAKRWAAPLSTTDGTFPPVSPEEAAAVRALVPSGLGDSSRKIRTAFALLIARVGSIDWPARWPELFSALTACVTRPLSTVSDRQLMDGAMRCFSYFIESVDRANSISASKALFPPCTALASAASSAPLALKRRALGIITALLKTLRSHAATNKAVARSVAAEVTPHVKGLVDLACAAFTDIPTNAEHVRFVGAALDLLTELLEDFGSLLAPHFKAATFAVFGFATKLLPAYVTLEVQDVAASLPSGTGGGEVDYDSDTDVTGLDVVVCRLLDFLGVWCNVQSPELQRVIKPWLKDVVGLAVGFAQLREVDCAEWEEDLEMFLSQSDEFDDLSASPRSSAVLLTREMVEMYGQTGLRAVVEAVAEKAMPSAALGGGITGSVAATAWKQLEAGLLVVGGVGPQLVSWWKTAGGSTKKPLRLRPEGVAGACFEMLTKGFTAVGLSASSSPDGKSALPPTARAAGNAARYAATFLRGRALWSAARLAGGLTEAQASPFIGACVAALDASEPGPVRVAACKALLLFAKKMGRASETVRSCIPAAVGALSTLLKASAAEPAVVNLVLRTLAVCLKAGPEAAASVARDLSTLLVALWIRAANHPIMGEDLAGAIGVLITNPDPLVAAMIAERFAPTFAGAVASATVETSGAASAAMQLIGQCLQHGPRPPVAPLIRTLPVLVQAATVSVDRSLTSSALETLAAFVNATGGGQLAAPEWAEPSTGRTALDTVLHALSLILSDPPADSLPSVETAALYAGDLAMAVGSSCSGQITPEAAASLVQLVARRAVLCRVPTVATRLLLALMSFLAAHPGPTMSALATTVVPTPDWVLTVWKQTETPPTATVHVLVGALLRTAMLWNNIDGPMAKTVVQTGVLKGLVTEGVIAGLDSTWVPVPAAHGGGRVPLAQRLIQQVGMELAERDALRTQAMGADWDEEDDDVEWGVDTSGEMMHGEGDLMGRDFVDFVYEDVPDAEDMDLSGLASAGMGLSGNFVDAEELGMLATLARGGAEDLMMGGGAMLGLQDDEDDELDEEGFVEYGGAGPRDIDAGMNDDRKEGWALEHPLKGSDRDLLARQFFSAVASAPDTLPLKVACTNAIGKLPPAIQARVIASMTTTTTS
jgi:hypothetical protein